MVYFIYLLQAEIFVKANGCANGITYVHALKYPNLPGVLMPDRVVHGKVESTQLPPKYAKVELINFEYMGYALP